MEPPELEYAAALLMLKLGGRLKQESGRFTGAYGAQPLARRRLAAPSQPDRVA
jgi:hypothetical protein